MAVLRMVHSHSQSQHNNNISGTQHFLHDFLGMKSTDTSTDVRLPEASVSASSADARGPFSSTSETASGKYY
ncbi:hypothetical protein MtrunA17_Chr4g0005121 [Medicago truncatula]|uniref:Uncharacterized protein n=1 Tax=Medicago truncatula TaxID=3880 RepID=A0A396I4Z6_MEDTR|nr:hypothetical protein MtrunA17_Chr4g0005121 [Medicago truncatula]